MKYFSEETVRQIVKDAMEYGMTISQTLPMDIEHYPNIEIKEPHGRCIDADEYAGQWDYSCSSGMYDEQFILKTINEAPTIVEANNV